MRSTAAIAALIALELLPLHVAANDVLDDVKGVWADGSRAFLSIYGKLKIDDDKVHWGRSKTGDETSDRVWFGCEARYEIIFTGYGVSYPGRLTNAEDQQYRFVRIKLLDKVCAIDEMANSHISARFEYFQFALPADEAGTAELIDYDEKLESGGWNKIYKRN